LPIHLTIGRILARVNRKIKMGFKPVPCGLDARMVARQSTDEQGAKSVGRGASVRSKTFPAVAIFAGQAGLIPHRIVVDEKESSVVKGRILPAGIVREVLTTLNKD